MTRRGRGRAATKMTTDRGGAEGAEAEAGVAAAAAAGLPPLPDHVRPMIEGVAETSAGGVAAAAAEVGAEMREIGGDTGEIGTAIVITTDGRGGAAARVARSAIEREGEGIAIDATRGSDRGREKGAAPLREEEMMRPRPHRPRPSHWVPRRLASTSRPRGCAPCRRTSRIDRAPNTSE